MNTFKLLAVASVMAVFASAGIANASAGIANPAKGPLDNYDVNGGEDTVNQIIGNAKSIK